MAQAPILNHLPITVLVECEAVDKGVQLVVGTPRFYAVEECGRFVQKGNLCTQHARELLGVRVQPSRIAGAGLGLFAAGRVFVRGGVIVEYEGEYMTRAAFDQSPSAYAAGIYNGVIDARRTSSGFGRFANAATRRANVNAQLITEKKLTRRGSGRKLFLQATRPIRDGDEILLAYGHQWWAANGPVRGV